MREYGGGGSGGVFCSLAVSFDEGEAVVATVLFADWGSSHPIKVRTFRWSCQEPQRVAQGLQEALKKLPVSAELLVVGDEVRFDASTSSLSAVLYEAMEHTVPVVGITTSSHSGWEPVRVVQRGNARLGVWVTARGVELPWAAAGVSQMHGPFRIPTMLRTAETLSRRPWLAS